MMVSSPVWSIAIRGRLCLACHKEGRRESQRVDEEKGLSCSGRGEDKPMAEEKAAAAAMITMNTIKGATTATAMHLRVRSNQCVQL